MRVNENTLDELLNTQENTQENTSENNINENICRKIEETEISENNNLSESIATNNNTNNNIIEMCKVSKAVFYCNICNFKCSKIKMLKHHEEKKHTKSSGLQIGSGSFGLILRQEMEWELLLSI